jgi:hypothetical protein
MKCKCGEEMKQIGGDDEYVYYYCLKDGRVCIDGWDTDETFKWYEHEGLKK